MSSNGDSPAVNNDGVTIMEGGSLRTANASKLQKLHSLLDQTTLYTEFLQQERLRSQQEARGRAEKDQEMKSSGKKGKKGKTGRGGKKSSEEGKDAGLALHPAQKLIKGGLLRQYQLEGVEWLVSLYENGLNGILADEMGLGKTLQVISFLAHLRSHGVPGPFLVTAPLSTLRQWHNEFSKWTPDVPAIVYHGSKEERAAMRLEHLTGRGKANDKSFPVVITSYEIAMRDRSALSNIKWKYLIVDEGHRLKNFNCKLITELKLYRSDNRLLLTGTPLQNNLRELWSLLNFLLPNIFDSLSRFEGWFAFDEKTIEDDNNARSLIEQERESQIISKLHAILKPFLLRRVKSDVEVNIPGKREIVLYTPMTEVQMSYYKAIVKRDSSLLPQRMAQISSARNMLMQLRKVCNHPFLIYEDLDEPSDLMSEEESVADETDMGDAVNSATKRKRGKDSGSDTNEVRKMRKREEEAASPSRSSRRRSASMRTASYKELSEADLTTAGADLDEEMHEAQEAREKERKARELLEEKRANATTDESIVRDCGKMRVLDALLKQLRADGHRVLIFSQMTRMLDVMEDYLRFRDYPYHRIDGSVSASDRHTAIDDFNGAGASDAFVFLLSTRAGGLGLNLTSADTVIIYDSDWNPTQDDQAQDRCHRIGQTKPVVVYRFITPNEPSVKSVEVKMLQRAKSKAKLGTLVLARGRLAGLDGSDTTLSVRERWQQTLKPLSVEELSNLLLEPESNRNEDQDAKGMNQDEEAASGGASLPTEVQTPRKARRSPSKGGTSAKKSHQRRQGKLSPSDVGFAPKQWKALLDRSPSSFSADGDAEFNALLDGKASVVKKHQNYLDVFMAQGEAGMAQDTSSSAAGSSNE